MEFRELKILCNNEQDFIETQKYLFRKGFDWIVSSKTSQVTRTWASNDIQFPAYLCLDGSSKPNIFWRSLTEISLDIEHYNIIDCKQLLLKYKLKQILNEGL